MRLNTIQPAEGSKSAAHRVGRGVGSGWGKTAGRGHKGQNPEPVDSIKLVSKAVRCPLHRRLPKRGFTSWTHANVAEVRLSDLEKLGLDEVNLGDLINANVIKAHSKDARVILSGEITRKVVVRGMSVTKGAKAAIEAAGGSVVVEEKSK